jgi:small subunit ribosomal protein S17
MREQRKRLTGVVSSDKMEKTDGRQCDHHQAHPRYKKVVRLVKKYKAHDESNEVRVKVIRVEIIESKPYSRHKRWAVVRVVERAR